MELWACGFNAFNQLQFDGDLPSEPHDFHEFQLVLKDKRIELLRTSVSSTLVQTLPGRRLAGLADELTDIYYHGVNFFHRHVAMAGNEKVAEFKSRSITEYKTFEAYLEKNEEIVRHFRDLKSIVANQTSFTALSSDGKVWTWGDGRYEACLGREMTRESPAIEPSLMEDLLDLPTGPVMKVASGGYVTAALTEGSDLYVWGGRPGQPKLFEPISKRPEPLDLDGQDFLDVAVGNDHMIVLTTDRRIFVIGAGRNGQLGMRAESLTDWKEISIPLKEGQRVVAVHAGYKNSFVLVDDTNQIDNAM